MLHGRRINQYLQWMFLCTVLIDWRFPQNCIIQVLPQYMNSWCGGRPVEELKHNKTSTLIQELILNTQTNYNLCVTRVYNKSTPNKYICSTKRRSVSIFCRVICCMPAEQRRVSIFMNVSSSTSDTSQPAAQH